MGLEDESAEIEPFPKVKAFVFDVDGTLMNTTPVFIDACNKEREVLYEILKDEETTQNLYAEFMKDMYKEGGKYKGILDMFVISHSFADDLIKRNFVREEDREKVEFHLKHVYDIIPEVYPDAFDLLTYLNDVGYQIAFSTHSGEWGKKKIEYMWNNIGLDINNLKYLSIPLAKQKDVYSWKEILKILNLKGSEIVVVGDNPKEDVENALNAGITRCIFVKRPLSEDYKFRERELNIGVNNNVKVWEVNNLSDIKDLFQNI